MDPVLKVLEPGLLPGPLFVRALAVDALMPWALWLFVRDFPRAPLGRLPRAAFGVAILLSLVVGGLAGIGWTTTELAGKAWQERSGGVAALASALHGSYYPILFALAAPALPWMLARARGAPSPERRRVLLFTSALLAGLAPSTAYILGAALVPGLLRLEASPAGRVLLNEARKSVV